MSKPILCLDFDGVIHDYREGWKGGNIYGRTTPGFWVWLDKALDIFQIVIYSSRSGNLDGLVQMGEWLGIQSQEHGVKELGTNYDWGKMGQIQWATSKPPAMLTIDDRALTFTGSWEDFDPTKLIEFKTWSQ